MSSKCLPWDACAYRICTLLFWLCCLNLVCSRRVKIHILAAIENITIWEQTTCWWIYNMTTNTCRIPPDLLHRKPSLCNITNFLKPFHLAQCSYFDFYAECRQWVIVVDGVNKTKVRQLDSVRETNVCFLVSSALYKGQNNHRLGVND